MKKTLKEFLEKNHACKDGFDFAKDLSLEEFLNTCERGDWILWLFAKTAAADADAAARAADAARAVAYAACHASSLAGNKLSFLDTSSRYQRVAARKQKQKLTADICRKYLPLEIWNQNLI